MLVPFFKVFGMTRASSGLELRANTLPLYRVGWGKSPSRVVVFILKKLTIPHRINKRIWDLKDVKFGSRNVINSSWKTFMILFSKINAYTLIKVRTV